MKKNIGPGGRLFRFAIAIVLLFLAYWQKSWICLAASLFVFYEAAASWCILYQLLGKNSCQIKK